jgi:hypothetical protein
VVLVSGAALCKMCATYAGKLFLSLQISQPSSNFVSLRSQLETRSGLFQEWKRYHEIVLSEHRESVRWTRVVGGGRGAARIGVNSRARKASMKREGDIV